MPNSKLKQAAWMRAYRASKKAGGTVLLPKALVRRLAAQGITPMRSLAAIPVSLEEYRAQGRLLEAKIARIEWQSSGIRKLQEEMVIERRRTTQLEADMAWLEAMLDSSLSETP